MKQKRDDSRHTYVCVDCGVRMDGRENPRTGEIHAYDRSPTSDGPPRRCLCMTCREKRADLEV
jgi:hypothetical protein